MNGAVMWMAIGVAMVCFFFAVPAAAQPAGSVAPGRQEVSAGAAWFGPAAVGSRDATLTGSGGDRFRLFSTSSDLGAATGFGVRLSRRIRGVVEAEATGSYAVPLLTTSITRDAEGAAPLAASEAVRQFTLEGGALVDLSRRFAGAHLRPFVSAGGGYLRQLHAGNILVQTGAIIYAGGGVKIPLGSRSGRSAFKQVGIRIDLRGVARSGGVTLDGRSHLAPSLAASVFARF
jgi:hypothetical protein